MKRAMTLMRTLMLEMMRRQNTYKVTHGTLPEDLGNISLSEVM